MLGGGGVNGGQGGRFGCSLGFAKVMIDLCGKWDICDDSYGGGGGEEARSGLTT